MSVIEIFKTIKAQHPMPVNSFLVISGVSLATWTIHILLKRKSQRKQYDNNQSCFNNDKTIKTLPLVVITGCDTGLGYSVVTRYLSYKWCSKCQNNNKMISSIFGCNHLIIPSEMAIIAFCLNPDGPGAKRLKQESRHNKNIKFFVEKLDLTDEESIEKAVKFLVDLVNRNPDENNAHNEKSQFKYKIQAFVNNAGRMIMAEYEWQTVPMILKQFDVNILGPMILTAKLMPQFRKDKSRVVNIISHCAIFPLPGVSIYGATKAALRAWTISSRIELKDHGVKLITFSPGSFFMHSSIMCGNQRIIDYGQIRDNLSDEQYSYYGSHMNNYQNYLDSLDKYIDPPGSIIPYNNKIYQLMDHALWAARPRDEYNVPEPWRYKVYYVLTRILNAFGLHDIKDQVVRRFVSSPQFEYSNQNEDEN